MHLYSEQEGHVAQKNVRTYVYSAKNSLPVKASSLVMSSRSNYIRSMVKNVSMLAVMIALLPIGKIASFSTFYPLTWSNTYKAQRERKVTACLVSAFLHVRL